MKCFDLFNKRVTLLLGNYTDLALGSGSIKVAMLSIWIDSGSLSKEVLMQQKMGLVLAPVRLQGRGYSEDLAVFVRFLMQVIQAQNKEKVLSTTGWLRSFENETEEAAILLELEVDALKELKVLSEQLHRGVERIVHTFGFKSFGLSSLQWVQTSGSSLFAPLDHPEWGKWNDHMLTVTQRLKKA